MASNGEIYATLKTVTESAITISYGPSPDNMTQSFTISDVSFGSDVIGDTSDYIGYSSALKKWFVVICGKYTNSVYCRYYVYYSSTSDITSNWMPSSNPIGSADKISADNHRYDMQVAILENDIITIRLEKALYYSTDLITWNKANGIYISSVYQNENPGSLVYHGGYIYGILENNESMKCEIYRTSSFSDTWELCYRFTKNTSFPDVRPTIVNNIIYFCAINLEKIHIVSGSNKSFKYTTINIDVSNSYATGRAIVYDHNGVARMLTYVEGYFSIYEKSGSTFTLIRSEQTDNLNLSSRYGDTDILNEYFVFSKYVLKHTYNSPNVVIENDVYPYVCIR